MPQFQLGYDGTEVVFDQSVEGVSPKSNLDLSIFNQSLFKCSCLCWPGCLGGVWHRGRAGGKVFSDSSFCSFSHCSPLHGPQVEWVHWELAVSSLFPLGRALLLEWDCALVRHQVTLILLLTMLIITKWNCCAPSSFDFWQGQIRKTGDQTPSIILYFLPKVDEDKKTIFEATFRITRVMVLQPKRPEAVSLSVAESLGWFSLPR